MLAAIHRQAAQGDISGVLVEAAAFHQDALGAIDQFAVGKLFRRRQEFLFQRLVRFEAGDGDGDHRLQPSWFQPVDDIGGDAGADGAADRLVVRFLSEDQHRARHVAFHDRQVFEGVARGGFGVDEYDVGADPRDLRREIVAVGQHRHHLMPGQREAGADIAGPAVQFVDDENF